MQARKGNNMTGIKEKKNGFGKKIKNLITTYYPILKNLSVIIKLNE